MRRRSGVVSVAVAARVGAVDVQRHRAGVRVVDAGQERPGARSRRGRRRSGGRRGGGSFCRSAGRVNCQFPAAGSYPQVEPADRVPASCETTAWSLPVDPARFTHADTVNDPVVSTTGPAGGDVLPGGARKLRPAAGPGHPDAAVARFPAPEVSATVVPEDWVSGHQAAGPSAPGSLAACDGLVAHRVVGVGRGLQRGGAALRHRLGDDVVVGGVGDGGGPVQAGRVDGLAGDPVGGVDGVVGGRSRRCWSTLAVRFPAGVVGVRLAR